ncbi:uncharacterized protein LOC110985310 [Acanthaster planci]|uniref:Uncharacterized protein LOC110985310 n=1 Tax=Acanthaster planci TaxID=133434 RepID=A0A8B7ZAU8_ACAPL|nr:uncharacterized protein LOC110985310 [Acanthaster planci]
MALSYSNSNIEACLVKPVLEKTAEAEDAISYTASTKHRRAWHIIQLVLHVVLFTAVIWLVVQVLHLQNELIQLNLRQSSKPGGDSSNFKGNHTMSSDSEGPRVRRQISHGDSIGMDSSYDYGYPGNEGFPSFHVTGIQQPVGGNWFTFHTSMDPAFSKYSHETLGFVHNKFFEVTMPGYYFVYSQICYKVNDLSNGHEVVVLPDCGDGVEFTILRAKAPQRTVDNGQTALEDTGYAGGVFYLAANDRLGVRPFPGQLVPLEYQDNVAQTSYFGAFLLTPDRHVEVDADLRRCL